MKDHLLHIQYICCNVFTNGGLATDIDGRVLTGDQVPIPGLYAVGETSGFIMENIQAVHLYYVA